MVIRSPNSCAYACPISIAPDISNALVIYTIPPNVLNDLKTKDPKFSGIIRPVDLVASELHGVWRSISFPDVEKGLHYITFDYISGEAYVQVHFKDICNLVTGGNLIFDI
jgi:hypothetical protein